MVQIKKKKISGMFVLRQFKPKKCLAEKCLIFTAYS